MSVGRPLEYDPEVALDAAMKLFWRKGYEATSLQDLLAAMGLSKSSFYQAFDSKHSLFERCIAHYREMTTAKFSTLLKQHHSARRFLEETFLQVANETRNPSTRKGCLLMNTANEFGQTDPAIANLVADSLDHIASIFAKAIQQAQQTGEIPTDKNATALANYLVCAMSGLKNMVKAGKDKNSINQMAHTALSVMN